jgi:hypothetical protein
LEFSSPNEYWPYDNDENNTTNNTLSKDRIELSSVRINENHDSTKNQRITIAPQTQ